MIQETEWYSLQTVELFPKFTLTEQQFENQQKNHSKTTVCHEHILYTNVSFLLTPHLSQYEKRSYILTFSVISDSQ